MNEGQLVGKFVWHDLVTTDVDRAVAFHTDVFGWGIKEIDMGPMGMYKMLHAAGTDLGGIKACPEGASTHWLHYVTVADVDATAAKVASLGGSLVVPATDIPGVGRFAVIADPTGGQTVPFTPNPWPAGKDTPPAEGHFCWLEHHATDPEGSAKFYAEIYGWRRETMETPMGPYHLFKRQGANGEVDAGGMLPKPAESGGPSAWVGYVAVADTDDRTARAEALGAKIWVRPTDVPNVGRMAVLSDPTGGMIAMLGPNKG